MHNAITKNANAIRTLLATKGHAQRAILSTANRKLIGILVDVMMDILKGKISVSRAQSERLRRMTTDVQKFTKKTTPLTVKRRILVKQKGGFFGLLAKIALPLLGNLFGVGGKGQ